MFKSQIEELLQVYECLFRDICGAFPSLRGELIKDYGSLVYHVASRGIGVLCVDLPNVGKHLDRCVSEGKTCTSCLPLTKRCPRCSHCPEFLRALWSLVFDVDGNLIESDSTIEPLLYLRQIYYLAKKADLDCPADAVYREVHEFVEVDLLLPEPERFWNEEVEASEARFDGFFRSPIYFAKADATEEPWKGPLTAFLRNLDLVSGLISADLGRYDPSEWRFRHGPGAVSERVGLVNKYQFVNWSERLESVFPIADYGFYNYESWGRFAGSDGEIGSESPSSRMISVRKTFTRPRLIAAEPTEHMWCQQNIWDYLCNRVASTWIAKFVRFRDQTRNQELCREGSKTGALATLDLSSASDRVSCHFVGNLFRANLGLLQALRSTRTRFIQQDLVNDLPRKLGLRKFSTMGSACTFPVETIGFLAVALAAIATVRKQRVTARYLESLSGEVGVFGDDMVVPTDCRELTCKSLEVLDFKVNLSKSYWNGSFRESCGVDAYRGVDMSPVYWRSVAGSKPESIVSTLEVRNSFYKRGYWAVAEYLTSTVRRVGIPTVSVDSGVFGFCAFAGPDLSGFKRRFNVALQRDEVRVLTMKSVQRTTELTDDSVMLQFFTEDPDPSTPWRGGLRQRPKTRLSLAWVETNDVVS